MIFINCCLNYVQIKKEKKSTKTWIFIKVKNRGWKTCLSKKKNKRKKNTNCLVMKNSLKSFEVKELLKKGKRIVSEDFVLVHKNLNKEGKNSAIIISKKNIRKASKRNYTRRVIRNLLKQNNIPFSKFILMYTGKDYEFKNIKKKLQTLISNL